VVRVSANIAKDGILVLRRLTFGFISIEQQAHK
jgi:hypothetical protein